MEGPLPHITLELRGRFTSAIKVAVPLAVFAVREVGVRPVMDLTVHFGILRIAGVYMGKESRDNGLVVGPPELHKMPVFLDGFVVEVGKVE